MVFRALALVALAATIHIPVEDGTRLKAMDVATNSVSYRGLKAVRVVEHPSPQYDGNAIAWVENVTFTNGTIEMECAGKPAAGSFEGARGFVGIAFRGTPDGRAYESFYVRPTNGRAEDQLRRNHSTQYISEPDYDFDRMRKEAPGVYESYVDLEAGAWTHIRIDVDGVKARLFVNRSAQPVLIVNDLKRGLSGGQIGLWIGVGTEAYFRNLRITPR